MTRFLSVEQRICCLLNLKSLIGPWPNLTRSRWTLRASPGKTCVQPRRWLPFWVRMDSISPKKMDFKNISFLFKDSSAKKLNLDIRHEIKTVHAILLAKYDKLWKFLGCYFHVRIPVLLPFEDPNSGRGLSFWHHPFNSKCPFAGKRPIDRVPIRI